MKIVTAAEMRKIDRVTSEKFGVPSLTLMENAGSTVAEFALSAYPAARSFGVICGKGNNGGDGFVVARKLHQAGREVRLLLLADPAELRGDAAENFKRLPKHARRGRAAGKKNEKPGTFRFSLNTLTPPPRAADSAALVPNAVFASDVLIDAVLGSGFRPPVSGWYADAIAKINAAAAPVIAVDIPSGANAEVVGDQTGAVARSDGIVTFTAPRPAHVFANLTPGPIVIAPIGSPDDAIQSSLNLNLITPGDIAPLLGPRPRNSNKGMFGHVLVVGGSLGKAGAAAMAGFSALRTGAGLVTVATPCSVLATLAGFHPELMTEPLSETDSGSIALGAIKGFWQAAQQKTVLAVGPGISRHLETAEFVRTIVQDSRIPIILDADGLNAFQGRAEELKRTDRQVKAKGREEPRTLVLTPHPGEMARLTGLSTAQIQRDRVSIAREFAQEHGLILVLKGDRTVVAGPEGEAWINPTGNPGMSTAGTGDILTGIVAGLLAQNQQRAFQSVMAAVYLHGLAGDIACEHLGELPLVATDLITALPEAFRRVRVEAAEKWVKIGMPTARAL